jgi:hypothetical protein
LIQARCYQITDQDAGRIEQVKALFALVSGGVVSYFKLGEGGWIPSAEVSSVVTSTDGTKVIAGTIAGPPVVPRTMTFSGPGAIGTLTDTVSSPYDGTGALVHHTHGKIGTINYKSGVFTAEYPGVLAGGQDVSCVRKHWGQFSGPKPFEISEGDGGKVYAGTVDCHPIFPGSVRVTDGAASPQVLTDNGLGVLSGDGSGTVDYDAGLVNVTFTSNVPGGQFVMVTAQAQGVPNPPHPGAADLGSVTEAGVYVPSFFTFTKAFVPSTDMAFQGVGTRTVRITMALLAGEANDDGNGDAPFFTEGGLFSANDTMLAYFTMPGIDKTGSSTWQRQMDFVV